MRKKIEKEKKNEQKKISNAETWTGKNEKREQRKKESRITNITGRKREKEVNKDNL